MKLEDFDDTVVLRVDDFMALTGLKKSKAYSVIKGILSISNIYDQHGRVTVYDYKLWLEYQKSKQKYTLASPKVLENTQTLIGNLS